jgi:hypothetical protein
MFILCVYDWSEFWNCDTRGLILDTYWLWSVSRSRPLNKDTRYPLKWTLGALKRRFVCCRKVQQKKFLVEWRKLILKKSLLERSTRAWKHNIKMNQKETGCELVDCIQILKLRSSSSVLYKPSLKFRHMKSEIFWCDVIQSGRKLQTFRR